MLKLENNRLNLLRAKFSCAHQILGGPLARAREGPARPAARSKRAGRLPAFKSRVQDASHRRTLCSEHGHCDSQGPSPRIPGCAAIMGMRGLTWNSESQIGGHESPHRFCPTTECTDARRSGVLEYINGST